MQADSLAQDSLMLSMNDSDDEFYRKFAFFLFCFHFVVINFNFIFKYSRCKANSVIG